LENSINKRKKSDKKKNETKMKNSLLGPSIPKGVVDDDVLDCEEDDEDDEYLEQQ